MSRLSLYDPFADVFPELFRGVFAPGTRGQGQVAGQGDTSQALEIRVEVKEAQNEYTVNAELPGVQKDDIHVEIDGNRVSITGEVKQESEKKDGERVLRCERYYGSVARSFTLANEIDEERAQAKFENGILSLTLPKKAASGGRKLQIG